MKSIIDVIGSHKGGEPNRSTPIDSELSVTSENAIQNKAVANALNDKASVSHTHTKAQITDLPAISNPNVLINPDFKINQREKSGTIVPNKNADGEDIHTYFVDRWGIDSGTVVINTDGTLTLNGTMSQILENAVGADVTASVSAGTAVYDDATKTFTITGNGDVISWAKLEYGSVETPFVPPVPALELLKCQRYYREIVGEFIPMIMASDVTTAYITIDNMRTSTLLPTVYFKNSIFNVNSGVRVTSNVGGAISGFDFSCVFAEKSEMIEVKATKIAHGLDRNTHVFVIDIDNPVCVDAEL